MVAKTFIKGAILSLALGCAATIGQCRAQETHALLQQPQNVTEGVLPSRTALLPYPNRSALDNQADTDMIVSLSKWSTDSLAGGAIRYSTPFKRNYRYDDRQLLLRVQDATGAIVVEVNGQQVGYSSVGIGRNEFDLTKVLKENHNTISITVLSDYAARKIERNRRANTTPAFASATLITPPRVAIYDVEAKTTFNKQGDGLLNLAVIMQSFLLNSKNYEVGYELLSPEGEVVASGKKNLTTRQLSRDKVSFFARIPNVQKWSPEEPTLYRLVLYTYHERRPKEFTSALIGFRTAELGEQGQLLINGQSIEINPTLAAHVGDDTATHLKQLKKQGYNLVYTAHPQPEEFYTECDRIGLLVCDGADIDCDGSDECSNNPIWRNAYEYRALDSYHSSWQHPSVVMFSIAGDAANGICLYESYLKMKALEDEKRPIVYPFAGGQWNSDMHIVLK